MLMMLMKLSFIPQHFFSFLFPRSGFHYKNSLKIFMLYILKIVTKFGVALQSLC